MPASNGFRVASGGRLQIPRPTLAMQDLFQLIAYPLLDFAERLPVRPNA